MLNAGEKTAWNAKRTRARDARVMLDGGRGREKRASRWRARVFPLAETRGHTLVRAVDTRSPEAAAPLVP